MDSIRFEPKVSAIIAIDRNLPGSGGDGFADMLGEQLKKRAEVDRPEQGIRRRPNGDRRVGSEDHPAPGRRPHLVIKNAHEFNDTATTARDVTPNREVRPTLPAPARDRPACEGEEHVTPGDAVVESEIPLADDKDRETNAIEAAPASVQPATDAAVEETPAEDIVAAPAIAIEPAPQDPARSIEAPADEAVIPAATPETLETTSPESEPRIAEAENGAAAQPAEEQAQVAFAANLAAALDDTVVGLLGSTESTETAGAQAPAAADLSTLAVPKPGKPATTDAAAAEATDLAARVTPEVPRQAAEIAARPAQRATPAAEIRAAQVAASHTPQPPAAPQALQVAPPVAALGQATADGFDPALLGEGAAAPGWTLHLAQGAAARRPDFIAQLRQHLQELPAHEQVAVNIRRAVRDGADRLSIQLSPAELGRIHVKLEMDEEKRAKASIMVEKPSTLELLQRDVKTLERALQDAGLKMDGNDLSFSLGRQDGEDFAQDLRQSGSDGYGDGSSEVEADVDAAAAQVTQLDTAAGLVNVQV